MSLFFGLLEPQSEQSGGSTGREVALRENLDRVFTQNIVEESFLTSDASSRFFHSTFSILASLLSPLFAVQPLLFTVPGSEPRSGAEFEPGLRLSQN